MSPLWKWWKPFYWPRINLNQQYVPLRRDQQAHRVKRISDRVWQDSLLTERIARFGFTWLLPLAPTSMISIRGQFMRWWSDVSTVSNFDASDAYFAPQGYQEETRPGCWVSEVCFSLAMSVVWRMDVFQRASSMMSTGLLWRLQAIYKVCVDWHRIKHGNISQQTVTTGERLCERLSG